MSFWKKIFGKKPKIDNVKSINDFSPEMQLKIEESRISCKLAVKIDKKLNKLFEIKDLRVACSVSENVTVAIEGFVKDEETKQEIGNHLLGSGVDELFNNLQIVD
jgi:ABC-type uncharacterized transport system YnjBCD ATPase subunit